MNDVMKMLKEIANEVGASEVKLTLKNSKGKMVEYTYNKNNYKVVRIK